MTELEGLIKGKCCAVCKHCYYTGLPGAVACEITEKFTDHFDSCEKFELSYVYWNFLMFIGR